MADESEPNIGAANIGALDTAEPPASPLLGVDGTGAKAVPVRAPDRAIASAARAALRFSLGITSSKLTVTVDGGVLSLYGTLDYEIEKTAARRCIEATQGVLRIEDHTTLSSGTIPSPDGARTP